MVSFRLNSIINQTDAPASNPLPSTVSLKKKKSTTDTQLQETKVYMRVYHLIHYKNFIGPLHVHLPFIFLCDSSINFWVAGHILPGI